MSEIPERLLCKSRAVIDDLDERCPFYLRFIDKNFRENKVTLDAIRAPDCSVNCGQFSEPEDVLLPRYDNQGVAKFHIEDLPEPNPEKTGVGSRQEVEYTFAVQHDPKCNTANPLEENYAHAEVRILKNGQYNRGTSINSTVKLNFRAELAKNLSVVIPPGPVK